MFTENRFLEDRHATLILMSNDSLKFNFLSKGKTQFHFTKRKIECCKGTKFIASNSTDFLL